MSELILRLLPDNGDPQDLVLLDHLVENSILDTAKLSTSFVFCDHKYQAQLINSAEPIENLRVFVNGEPIRINYSPDSGHITFFDDSFGARIFQECYGFVQITVLYNDTSGNQFLRDTEYIQVMVRKGRQNDSVRRITEYVYTQNAELLYGKSLPRETAGLKDNAKKTLESRILLLERIAVVYEENYRYFKTNCRFKTVSHERVDHFEKLQYVSSNTLQYIAQHPEELQPVHYSTGIKVGRNFYQPNKTLITDNVKSVDIYENQVVIGFLMYLNAEIARIEQELISITSSVPQQIFETDDYVTSSYFIYANTIASLKILLTDVKKLRQKYDYLYISYSAVLPVKVTPVTSLPRFTHLFKSIQQYHQIYQCAISWFSMGAFDLSEENFMLSFIKMSALYEVYVLAKIIAFFKSAGFELADTNRLLYPVSSTSRFRNAHCNNVYVFKKDISTVTVYYQPVIFSTDMSSFSGIGLYRNTAISFPDSDAGSIIQRRTQSNNPMYTPDFLLKYETEGSTGARYLLADAKFSTVKTVRTHQVAKLAYKYLFSISPVSASDTVVGLCVFNGQSDTDTDKAYNIYDFDLANTISPKAEIITLTENSTENRALHEVLLHNSVGLYLSHPPRRVIQLPRPESSPETIRKPTRAETPQALTASPGNDTTVTAAPPVELPVTPMHNAMPSDSPMVNNPSSLSSNAPNLIAPPKQSAKQKAKIDSSPMLEDIAVLKLDKNTVTRLQEAGIITIGDLVPNRSKHDLANNPLLNRKLRREIEARLKALKVVLSASSVPKVQSKPTPKFQIPQLPQENLKIGEFVRLALSNLSTSGYEFKPSEIDEMCTPEWSIKTFHTQNAFMKRYTPGFTDNKGPDGYVRFWSEPFTFGGVQVLISKEWFEGNQRNYFMTWYNSLGET